jgi:hypothetical protein
VAEAGLRAPLAVGVGDRFQKVAVEPFFMAVVREEALH